MKAQIEHWIKELHEQGQVSRLMVNSTVDGVEIPDWVREQWAEALPIGLDPSFPLELRFEDEGLHCCLSFGGPWNCFFPWSSIYVVQERDSQIGVVIDDNLPEQFEMGINSDVESPDRHADDLEQNVESEPAVITPTTTPDSAQTDTAPTETAETAETA